MSSVPTPVRSLGTMTEAGYRMLRETGTAYRDGSEERVLKILQDCSDVSADSDESLLAAKTWAERYHTSPARANILRNLPLSGQASVLEIGAGCGALTRYLGEHCALVDALEPVEIRAVAARERCRGLTNVDVMVGELEDIPDEPSYEIVVVVGVLEYVGAGSADPARYREFLAAIGRRLRPGGTLVLAIENKLGVKYLAGAPEDHSGRVFDSLESYPYGAPARTFSRLELESLLNGAGLTPQTALAFPDYKMTRAVLRPQNLPAAASSLLYRVPNFPSPDRDSAVHREHLVNERLLWRSLVDAGLALETGNSFVVLAGKGGISRLWEDTSAGTFYSLERRRPFMVQTELLVEAGRTTLSRTRVESDRTEQTARLAGREWVHRVNTAPFVAGQDFLAVFKDMDDPASVLLLQEWATLVRATDGCATRSVDLVPHNLLVDTGSKLVAIDEEWHSATLTARDVLRRGAILFALRLAEFGRITAGWQGCQTFADIARSVAQGVGVADDPGWFDLAIGLEAEFLQAVTPQQHGQSDIDRRSVLIDYLRGLLDRDVRTPVDFTERVEGLQSVAAGLSHEHAQSRLELAADRENLEMYALHVAGQEQDLQTLRMDIERIRGELIGQYRQKLATNTEIIELRSKLADAQELIGTIVATKSYRAARVLRVMRGWLRR